MEIVHSRNNKLRARFRSLYCIPILSGYVISKCRISNVIIYRFIYFFLFLSHFSSFYFYLITIHAEIESFIYLFIFLQGKNFIPHFSWQVSQDYFIVMLLFRNFRVFSEFVTISINIEQKNQCRI